MTASRGLVRRLVLAALAALVVAGCTGTIEGAAVDTDPTDTGCPGAPLDARIAEATLGDTGTSITLAWSRVGGASSYRVERASAAREDWAAIGETDAVTLADPTPLVDDARYRVVAVGARCQAPGAVIAARAIAAERYAIAAQSVPGVAFKPTLEGVVRYPKRRGAAPSPLVLVLHGNHGICRGGGADRCPALADIGAVDNRCPLAGATTVPNADGYDYLLETLAAQGYVAVSIDGNAFNCRIDFIPERAELIVEHLRRWTAFASSAGAAPLGQAFAGAVDLSRVGLIGHSRGGAAVTLVPSLLAESPVPGATVRSILAIAPSDSGGGPPTDVAYATLVPGCDADVWPLQGIAIWDRLRHADGDLPRSQMVLIGANHNFFSTEWKTDDNDDAEAGNRPRSCTASVLVGGGTQPAASAQQGMLELAAPAWFDATLRGAPMAPFLRGEEGAPSAMRAWAGAELDLRTSYVGPGLQVIDNLSGTASDGSVAVPAALDGTSGFATSAACNADTCDDLLGVCTGAGCGDGPCEGEGCALPFQLWHSGQDVDALALAWTSGRGDATFFLGDRALGADQALSLRMALADSDLNAEGAAAELSLVVSDRSGHRGRLLLSELASVPRLYRVRGAAAGDAAANVRPARELLQTVRIPAVRLRAAAPELDLQHLGSLELLTDAPSRPHGALFVTDVTISR